MKFLCNRFQYLVLAVLGALFAKSVLAAPAAESYKTFDSNRDGIVSMVEFVALGDGAPILHAADIRGNCRSRADAVTDTAAHKGSGREVKFRTGQAGRSDDVKRPTTHCTSSTDG